MNLKATTQCWKIWTVLLSIEGVLCKRFSKGFISLYELMGSQNVVFKNLGKQKIPPWFDLQNSFTPFDVNWAKGVHRNVGVFFPSNLCASQDLSSGCIYFRNVHWVDFSFDKCHVWCSQDKKQGWYKDPSFIREIRLGNLCKECKQWEWWEHSTWAHKLEQMETLHIPNSGWTLGK